MLADRVGQPFNAPLQDQLRVIINYKRADWFQKVLDKHPEQRKYFTKDFSAELMETDKAECPIEVGCDILKTVDIIPLPIRTSDTLFDFVGSVDKSMSYRYMTPDQFVYASKYNKYTSRNPSYYYSNNRIYIYNDLDENYISIRGVFSDPRVLQPFKCAGTPCYTDDDQFEIPEDIINIIIQDVLKNELRTLFPQVGESEITNRPDNG